MKQLIINNYKKIAEGKEDPKKKKKKTNFVKKTLHHG